MYSDKKDMKVLGYKPIYKYSDKILEIKYCDKTNDREPKKIL